MKSSGFSQLNKAQIIWLMLAVMVPFFFILAIDLGILNNLLVIKQDLHLTSAEMNWLFTGYIIFATIPIVPAGRYGDDFGHFNLFFIGECLLIAGLILLSIGSNEWLVLLGRVLCGLGNGTMLPNGVAILKCALPERWKNWALIVFTGVCLLGLAMGSLFAGLFADTVSWKMLYWVPLSMVVLLPLTFYLRRFEHPHHRHVPVDYLGTALLTAFLVIFVLLFTEGETWGWDSAALITFYVLAPLLLLGLLFSQTRVKAPLISYRLCANFPFFMSCLVMFFSESAFAIVLYFYCVYAHLPAGLNYSMLVTGATLLPATAVPFLLSFFVPRWSQKIGYEWILMMGGICAFVGMLVMIWISPTTSYVNIWWRLIFVGLMTLDWIAISPYALRFIPEAQAGAAMGIFELFRFIGFIVGNGIAAALFESTLNRQGAQVLGALGLNVQQSKAIVQASQETQAFFTRFLMEHFPNAQQILYTSMQTVTYAAYRHAMYVGMISGAIVLVLTLLILGYRYYVS